MSAAVRVNLLRRVGASSTPAALVVARVCQLDRSVAEVLVRRLGVLPRAFDELDASKLVAGLREAGVEAEVIPGPATASSRCAVHGSLEAAVTCEGCGASTCVVCLGDSPRAMCLDCQAKARRRLGFRNARVGVLLVFLACIGFWGVSRQLRLDRRTQWKQPLTVSVVLVTRDPPSEAVVARWQAASEALTAWFTSEWARYRPAMAQAPVQFVLERVATVEAMPVAPSDTESAVAFERALNAIDAQVGVRHNDATVYVELGAEPSARVEGIGEAGGRRGLVVADLAATEVTLESVAVAHELLHCLGASDKYDAEGHAVVPGGLVAPEQQPLYPQPGAEVMVGEIATGPSSGEPIRSLAQVHVGAATAREVHW